MKLRTSFFALVTLLVTQLAGAKAVRETVVIGAEDDWYPYGGAINGESRGFGVDLVRASFAAVGIDVKFIPLPYKRCIEMTRHGSLLACNEPTRLPESEDNFLWPAKPLFAARAMIYARRPSNEKNLGVTALEGRHVAVTNGYEYGSAFDLNKDILREVVSKEISVFRMLAAGRVEFAMAYEKVANHLIRETPGEFKDRFTPVGVTAVNDQYCAFSKTFPNSERYLKLFNEGFARIQADGSYREIEHRWP